jgi:peptide/nickel transport system permease protein
VLRFVGQRLLQLIPVAIGITLVVFFLVRLIPGDPAVTILGVHATPANVSRVRAQLGLNHSILDQYWLFLSHAVTGNLGYSYFYAQTAASLVWQRLAPTLFLVGYSVVLTVVIGVPLAVVAALRANTWADRSVNSVLVVGLALPAYWLGTLFILLFALNLGGLFPVGGYGSGFGGHVYSLFLPALTLSIGLLPLVVRSLRASLIQSLRADYIDMVRAKGVPERVVVQRALRNALVPTVTILGVNVGFLFGAVVIIEAVFGLPGLGGLMLQAIDTRDYPTVQAATLFFAILVVCVNLAADIVNAFLDPRIRVQRGER